VRGDRPASAASSSRLRRSATRRSSTVVGDDCDAWLVPETFTAHKGRAAGASPFRHKSGFNAADVPAVRGRPPDGTRVDGREITGHEHREQVAKRDALRAAGGPRPQAALSLLRRGLIDAEVRRTAVTLARSRLVEKAQNTYDYARQLGDPSATARARQERDRAEVTKPSDVATAQALAGMLPARAPRRPALGDKRAMTAQAIEWETRRLQRADKRERERLMDLATIARRATARQLHAHIAASLAAMVRRVGPPT